MNIKKITFLSLVLLILIQVWAYLKPLGDPLKKMDYSQLVLGADGDLLRITLSSDQKYRLPTNIDNVSKKTIESILMYEDQYFYWHVGFNPFSLMRATFSTYIEKSRIVGGSTITMQLARLLFKFKTRSLSGKIKQLLYSVYLESVYSKKELLEAYLSLTPYGRNIEGISAASLIYLKKPLEKLNLSESILMAVVPQSPQKKSRVLNKNKLPSRLLTSAKLLRSQWVSKFPNEVEKISFQGINFHSISDLPFLAPHFSRKVLKENPNLVGIKTSLKLDLQKTIEELGRSYLQAHKQVGVENFSALLIDTNSMNVLSYVGSSDFFNSKIRGQVDGVTSNRSPGSSLKPFVYAQALDMGEVHPLTMIKDSPHRYGVSYLENFDYKFKGPISTTEALVQSRNVPALKLLKAVGWNKFFNFLNSVGVSLPNSPEHYGFSILLGAAEVSMVNLIEMYAMLNNNGDYKSINFLRKPRKSVSFSKVISSESAFLVRDMLFQNPPPRDGMYSMWQRNKNQIAWKTGTSSEFKDAWAIGVFDKYALAVWLGNFSGEGNPAFVGRSLAGPLFFQIIQALSKVTPIRFTRPDVPQELNLVETEFCKLSGRLPSPACHHKVVGHFIPGTSPIEKCTIHREIEIDISTGLQACESLNTKKRRQVFEYWPTDILKLFAQAGLGRIVPPPQHPKCTSENKSYTEPVIISPKSDVVYSLRTRGTGAVNVPLISVGDGDVRQVKWYVDEKFVGSSQVDKPLVWPLRKGVHMVKVIDERGRYDEVKFKVQLIQ